MQPFEIIDHTADVGLAAHGATREQLFANAALGMATIIGDIDKVRETETREVHVTASDIAALLATFLSELLYLLEVEHFVCRRADVESVTETDVRATAYGEPISPEHDLHTEIKAVTHHDLTVEQRNDAWHATVLFDI